jgi:hypothetical protein
VVHSVSIRVECRRLRQWTFDEGTALVGRGRSAYGGSSHDSNGLNGLHGERLPVKGLRECVVSAKELGLRLKQREVASWEGVSVPQ